MSSTARYTSTTDKIKQQELAAWEPIVTPSVLVVIFLAIGLCFIPSGIVSIRSYRNSFECSVTYDDGIVDPVDPSDDCKINESNAGYKDIVAGVSRDCEVTFVIPNDVSNREDIYIYFELENVYQNHRRYVLSKSDKQLLDEVTLDDNFESLEEAFEDDCDPENSLYSNFSDANLLYYPCGLIAQSYFNDGIQIKSFSRKGEFNLSWVNTIFDPASSTGDKSLSISIDQTKIAWRNDLQNNFRNPSSSNGHPRYDYFEYIWQTYDQFSCYDAKNPANRTTCWTWKDYSRAKQSSLPEDASVPGQGCAPECVNKADIMVNEGGIPPPDIFDPRSANGIRYENFIVWMKTAALPTFRKLYGRLTVQPRSWTDSIAGTSNGSIPLNSNKQSPSEVKFLAGDEVKFRIIPNFLVSEYKGKKKLILTTLPPMDSNIKRVGRASLIVGGTAIVLAFLVFLKLKIRPRKLGDPKYLMYNNN